jgi:Uma2 family endonuclease
MVAHAKLATALDLENLPGDVRAEIIHGAIVQKAGPSAEHSRAQLRFGTALGRRFDRRPGGRWPGGWWFGSEVEVEYEAHEVYVHDVAGWRRERVLVEPVGRPTRVRPDWVCELLSPTTARRDRVEKFQVLHRCEVQHYWLVDPLERSLVVHRWQPRGYLVALTAGAGDVVRAEPFDAVELKVSVLFGLEDDED